MTVVGDLIWSLPPVLVMNVPAKLYATVTIANPTDEARNYMLMTRSVRLGQTLEEGTITIDGTTWCIVGAEDTLILEGEVSLNYTDIELFLDLYEGDSADEVIDSVSVIMVSPEAAGISLYGIVISGGRAGTTDLFSSIMTMMVLMMVMGMMMKSLQPAKEKPR